MNRVEKVHLKWVVVIIQKGTLSPVVTLVISQGKKRKQKKRVAFASNTNITITNRSKKKSKPANLIHPIGKKTPNGANLVKKPHMRTKNDKIIQ
jgi:hypothetical protein